MILNDPNTDSAEFEQLSIFFNSTGGNYKLLTGDKLNSIIDLFYEELLYKKTVRIVNVIENVIKEEKESIYFIHVLIDEGFKVSNKYGQRDLGYIENLWALKLNAKNYGKIVVATKANTKSKAEVFLEKLLSKLFKKEMVGFDIFPFYDISFTDSELFKEFIELNCIKSTLKKPRDIYIKHNDTKHIVGNYSPNLKSNLNFYLGYFRQCQL